MKNQYTNEASLFNMYDILGELLSLNHTCLRIANQDGSVYADKTIVSGSEVFDQKDSLKSVWVSKKLKDAAEIRNEVYSENLTAWDLYKNELFAGIDIDQTLKNKQTSLVKAHNAYFGEKKSFKEIFNGFNSTNPDFQKIIQIFDTHKCIQIEDEKLNILLQHYFEYFELLESYMSFKFFEDIASVAKNDVLETGRPSMLFRKTDENVTTMSEEEIEKHIENASAALKTVNKEIKTQNRKLAPLYKKARNNFNDYAVHDEISKIKSIIFNLLEKQKKAERYQQFAKKLLERLVYMNTDYDSSKSLRFWEGFLDLTIGINVFKKENKLFFDDVYVHKLEKSYLTYFESLFKDSSTFESLKTTQTPQQSI